jgi:hypothetical protein
LGTFQLIQASVEVSELIPHTEMEITVLAASSQDRRKIRKGASRTLGLDQAPFQLL